MVRGAFPAGGTAGLTDLIDVFGQALYADFRRFYNLDFLAWFRGEISTRETLWLIEALPDTGAFAAMQRDPNTPSLPTDDSGDTTVVPPSWMEQVGWGLDRHVAALTADATMAAVAGKGKPPRIPRPKEKQAAGQSLSAQVNALFAAHEAQKNA